MSDERLKPITVYLSPEEVDELNREADEHGQSGASARIRWILWQRRRERSENVSRP